MGDVWSHGGFKDGVRTHLHLWPRHRLGVVLLQNGEAPYEVAMQRLKDAVVAAASVLDPAGTLALSKVV